TRIARLTSSRVERLERQHLGKSFDGWALERIRRLRQCLARQLQEKAAIPEQARPIKKDLEEMLFFENLSAQSLEYLYESPTPERLAETVQRIEETVFDGPETPVTPMGAAVQIGAPIDVRTFSAREGGERRGPAPLVLKLRQDIQGLLDRQLEQGPPAEWNCPARAPAVVKPPRVEHNNLAPTS